MSTAAISKFPLAENDMGLPVERQLFSIAWKNFRQVLTLWVFWGGHDFL